MELSTLSIIIWLAQFKKLFSMFAGFSLIVVFISGIFYYLSYNTLINDDLMINNISKKFLKFSIPFFIITGILASAIPDLPTILAIASVELGNDLIESEFFLNLLERMKEGY